MGGFSHRELDVYKRATKAIALIARITSAIPGRDGWLAKQVRRSGGSILLNLGEGCGEHSSLEKARIIRISRRSAFEAGDGLQLVKIYTKPDIALIDEADAELVGVTSMLTKLAMRREEDGLRKLSQKRGRKKTCTCPCTCS
jgi:four helix bundle protein